MESIPILPTLPSTPMLCAALLTFAAVALAAPSSDPPPLSEARIEDYTLDNGLRVVLYHDDRYPLVESRVVYDVGSIDDPAGKGGLAHLTEHINASGAFPGGMAALTRFREDGTSTNAFTHTTVTVYVARTPASRLDVILWNESNRMRGTPRLTRTFLEAERKIVAEETTQRMHGDIRDREIAGLLDLLATSGGRDMRTTTQSLARITAEDADALVRENYVPANATLVLAGDLPSDVDARIEDYFGSLPAGVDTENARKSAAPLPKAVHARARGFVPGAMMLWTIPGAYADGDAEARIVAALLDAAAQGEGARAVEIDATVYRLVDESFLFVRVEGAPGSQPTALLADVDAALSSISRAAVAPADVRAASRRAVVQMRREVGTLAGCADRLASYVAADKPAAWLPEDERRVAAVNVASVAAFTKSWLVGRPRIALLVDAEAAP